MGRKLMALALAVVLMMVCGCGGKSGDNKQSSEKLDVSYYRKIMMLPDGKLLCSMEVEANKVANAGEVFKVEKKDGQIKKITALYDGEKNTWVLGGKIFILETEYSISKPDSLMAVRDKMGIGSMIPVRELEVLKDGNDLVYKFIPSGDKEGEWRFKEGANGQAKAEMQREWQFQYDDRGRCVAKTNKHKRIEYSYEGDSVLPVGLQEFNFDGKKSRWNVSMKWDEYNRLVEVIWHDNSSKRFESEDNVGIGRNFSLLMAEQVKLYYENDNPNPISVRGYNLSGKPRVSTERKVHEYAYRYDDKGNLVSVESLGIHGQPVMALKFNCYDSRHEDSFYAAVRYAYDEKGWVVATATYGTDGRPINGCEGYAEHDLSYRDDFMREGSYFGALGQPVDCKFDKKIPPYHRSFVIIRHDSEWHYYNTSGKWLGISKHNEFSNSSSNKNEKCEKRVKEPLQPIILGKMGLMKFVHEDKPVNEQTPTATATPQSRPAPANSGSTVSMEPKSPEQILQLFHQNITSKDYRKAYHFLSKDFQASAPYDGWAAGFQTTVSSTVSDVKVESQTGGQTVLTYTLKAVDNPGGTNYFRGTAVLIWTDAHGWRIDDMTNKPM